MNETQINRNSALELLKRFTKSESLIKHALAVEAVMKHFARLFGLGEEEVTKWGIIGLLHDLDYEMYPEQHCKKVREILMNYGYPEEYIRAIESHGYNIVNDVKPLHKMEKVLYTVDELSGLITAVAILRPSRSLFDLKVSSVKKKWKQKSFANGINRKVIEDGAQMLQMDLDYIIEQTIVGMQSVAEEIDLKGNM